MMRQIYGDLKGHGNYSYNFLTLQIHSALTIVSVILYVVM